MYNNFMINFVITFNLFAFNFDKFKFVIYFIMLIAHYYLIF